MEQSDVIRLGMILATQAEIEGMKARNEIRRLYDNRPEYDENDFEAKAKELRGLSYRAIGP